MNEIEDQKDYHMIRPMKAKDTDCVLEMMQVFYASPAVFTNGSDNIFLSDIAACVGDSPYLEGYIFEEGMEILGYAMIVRAFRQSLESHVCGLRISIFAKPTGEPVLEVSFWII